MLTYHAMCHKCHSNFMTVLTDGASKRGWWGSAIETSSVFRAPPSIAAPPSMLIRSRTRCLQSGLWLWLWLWYPKSQKKFGTTKVDFKGPPLKLAHIWYQKCAYFRENSSFSRFFLDFFFKIFFSWNFFFLKIFLEKFSTFVWKLLDFFWKSSWNQLKLVKKVRFSPQKGYPLKVGPCWVPNFWL